MINFWGVPKQAPGRSKSMDGSVVAQNQIGEIE